MITSFDREIHSITINDDELWQKYMILNWTLYGISWNSFCVHKLIKLIECCWVIIWFKGWVTETEAFTLKSGGCGLGYWLRNGISSFSSDRWRMISTQTNRQNMKYIYSSWQIISYLFHMMCVLFLFLLKRSKTDYEVALVFFYALKWGFILGFRFPFPWEGRQSPKKVAKNKRAGLLGI